MLWTPETGGHNELYPIPQHVQRRDTLSTPTKDNKTVLQETASDLFNPQLIPEISALPKGYVMRPLRENDHEKGYLETLTALTTVGEIDAVQWQQQFRWMQRRGEEYFVLVVCDESGQCVGAGTLLVERKFIHQLGKVGHIEDIVVRKDQQGKHLGLRIIEALDHIARRVGCYKAILDCSGNNEGFYLKCGYKQAGVQMAHYFGS